MTSVTTTEDNTIETKGINWFNAGVFLLIAFVGMLVIFYLPENIHSFIFYFSIFLFLDIFIILFWISIGSDVLKRPIDPMKNKITESIYIDSFLPFVMGVVFAKWFIDRNLADKSIQTQTSFNEVFAIFSAFFIVGSLFVMLIILLGMATYKGIIVFNKRWSSWETKETNKEIISSAFVLIVVVLFLLELILSVIFGQGYIVGDIYYFENLNLFLGLTSVVGFGVCIWAIGTLFKDIFFTLPKKLAKEN